MHRSVHIAAVRILALRGPRDCPLPPSMIRSSHERVPRRCTGASDPRWPPSKSSAPPTTTAFPRVRSTCRYLAGRHDDAVQWWRASIKAAARPRDSKVDVNGLAILRRGGADSWLPIRGPESDNFSDAFTQNRTTVEQIASFRAVKIIVDCFDTPSIESGS
jgi:hypothetical protein